LFFCGCRVKNRAVIQALGNRIPPFFLSGESPFAGGEGVLHEHRDGHGAYAARDGSDGFAEGGDFLECDIADETVAFRARRVFDAVDPDIDDDGTLRNMFFFQKIRSADGGDYNVGAAGDFREVAGAGMGEGDGGIAAFAFAHQEQCHRFADDAASPDDNDIGTGGFDSGFGEQAATA